MTPADTFYEAVLERWTLSEPELVILEQAASTLALIAELEGSDLPLHLRARELRAQRLAFGRLLSQLSLPDGQGGRVASSTHHRARRAAEARWGRTG